MPSDGLIEFDGDTLNNPTAISIIISSFICFFVYTPLGVYYGWKFYLNHSHIIFAKRYSKITLYEIVLMTIKIIWVPIEQLSDYYTAHNDWSHQLILLGNIILAYLVLYCWVWRQWLCHFDIVLAATIVNNQWRLYIDAEFEESQLNGSIKWYLQNKSTFGNYKWTRNRILIIAIICILVTFSALFSAAMVPSWNHNPQMWFYMGLVCLIPYFSPMIFLIIIYIKTPKFDDNYFIQQELRYIFFSLSIMYTAYLITFIYLSFSAPKDETILVLILSIENNIVIFCQFCCLMIATYWVNDKMNKIIGTNSYEKVSKSYLSGIITSTHSTSITHSLLNDPGVELIHVQPTENKKRNSSRASSNSLVSNSNNSNVSEHANLLGSKKQESDITLYQVLSHIKSFELYMVHLSREFSLECLLSTIEFIEYQKLILSIININDESNHEQIQDIKGNKYNKNRQLWCDIIKLPETLPKSKIVYGDARGDTRLANCKIKAWAIYTKYIQQGSDFEINIPGDMRSKYKRLMGNYNEWINKSNDVYDIYSLLLLFDPLIEQMVSLMADCFRRFAQSLDFKKLEKLLFL
eukprot:333762_1